MLRKSSAPTCGVSRVDDNNGSGFTVGLGLTDGTVKLIQVQGPVVGLIQVVANLHMVSIINALKITRGRGGAVMMVVMVSCALCGGALCWWSVL